MKNGDLKIGDMLVFTEWSYNPNISGPTNPNTRRLLILSTVKKNKNEVNITYLNVDSLVVYSHISLLCEIISKDIVVYSAA